VLAEPLKIVGGMAQTGARPGAGIAWNEENIARWLC
jgi:hypothetical protein